MKHLPELPPVHVIGFQGQDEATPNPALGAAIRGQLQALQSATPRILALGGLTNRSDFLFVQEALALKLPLVVLLPKPAAEWKAELSAELRVDFDRLLSEAGRVEILSPVVSPHLALHLGQKLVGQVDTLLALAGEAGKDDHSVTAKIIAFATEQGRTVIGLHETNQGIEVRVMKPGTSSIATGAGIASLKTALGDEPPTPKLPEELVHYFEACDAEASRTAPQLRRYLLNIVLANAIAAMTGSIQTSFTQTPVTAALLTSIKFGCILAGFAIFIMLRRRESQNRWLDLRVKAEVARSALATWLSPHPIEPLSPDENPELRRLVQTIRYLHALHPPASIISLDDFKTDYGHRRILDQCRYFQGQADKAEVISSRLTPLYWFFSLISLVTSAGAVIYGAIAHHAFPHGTWGNFVLAFVPAVAPALASWILAFQAIQSIGRRRTRFREMEQALHRELTNLVHAPSWDAAAEVVLRTEKLLLSEVLEWYSFIKHGR